MLLRGCVPAARSLRCNVRGALAVRGTGLRVLMVRRTRLRARHVSVLCRACIRRPVGELARVVLHIVRRVALRRRRRIWWPVGELSRVALRVVRYAALRVELPLTRQSAGRTVRGRMVGKGAALRMGRVNLRMREGIVALRIAVLDRTIIVGQGAA